MRKLILFLLSLTLSASVSGQSCCDKDDVLYQGETGNWFPRPQVNAAAPAQRTCTIDANLEACAWVFQAPKTGSITDLYFRTQTVTTGDTFTITVTLESVDATTGFPNGVIAANRSCTVAMANADDNVWKSCTMTTPYSATQGDILAIKASTDGGNMNLVHGMSNSHSGGFPYVASFLASSWAFVLDTQPVFAFKYSDGTFHNVPGAIPTASLTTTAFASGSTPDEIGILYSNKNRRRACGAWVLTNSAADFDIVLYSGTTAIRTITVDGNILASGANTEVISMLFSSCLVLGANQTYRLVVKPGASNVTIYEFTTSEAAMMGMFDGGTKIYRTSRTDAAASWTDSATTTRPLIGFIE